MKNKTNTNLIIRSILALAFAISLVIWSPLQTLSAESADGNMMNHADGGNMMNHTYGWMGGGIGLWTVIGVLVAILLVVLIIKLSKK